MHEQCNTYVVKVFLDAPTAASYSNDREDREAPKGTLLGLV